MLFAKYVYAVDVAAVTLLIAADRKFFAIALIATTALPVFYLVKHAAIKYRDEQIMSRHRATVDLQRVGDERIAAD